VDRTNREDAASAGGELEALRLIGSILPTAPSGEVWMGDDAAWIESREGRILATVDAVVEGVHADLSLVGLDDFGWRAVTTAVSDIAAMGGTADQLLVSVVGPPGTDLGLLYDGIRDAARDTAAAVVGGELSTAPALVVVVTVLGHLGPGSAPVMRSGACPGDAILVTGALSAAAAGLRLLRAGTANPTADEAAAIEAHRRPVARLAEGRAARESGATAMIDLSDGLASDLRRIAEASGVGLRIEDVPRAACATEHDSICGGDDYELVACTPDPAALVERFATRGLRRPIIIGECTADPSELTLRDRPLPDCGWEHPFEIPARRD
jgi:thiamine-monophosphate kinase